VPDSHRVFFALWPDEDVARQLDEAGQRAQAALGGRRMRRDTLHLTLAFVGAVPGGRMPTLRGIAEAIAQPSFTLNFAHIACVRRKNIAWAAAEPPPELPGLVAALRTGLMAENFRTEDRSFAAHVTLLRHACCENEGTARDACLHIEWPVRDFVLVESELKPEGARYRIVGRWPLSTGNRQATPVSQT
jgi:2'-5' RNA ligase